MNKNNRDQQKQQAVDNILCGSSKCVSQFTKLHEIGQGTYGKVCECSIIQKLKIDLSRENKSGKLYALKKINMAISQSSGFPLTSIRQIKILKSIDHPNIIKLRQVVVGLKQSKQVSHLNNFFDYCDTDLANLLDFMVEHKLVLSKRDVKCIIVQVLKAIQYLHQNGFLHWDIKFSNLLINKSGEVKLADFGLAREVSRPLNKMTPKVVTLWYRAPQVLMKSQYYSYPSDMWWIIIIGQLDVYSLNYLITECLYFQQARNEARQCLQGKNQVDQFIKISELIGRPNEMTWKNFIQFKGAARLLQITSQSRQFINFEFQMILSKNLIIQRFEKETDLCQQFLNKLLDWDPKNRMTASEALIHPYVSQSPFPTNSEEIQCLKYIDLINRKDV